MSIQGIVWNPTSPPMTSCKKRKRIQTIINRTTASGLQRFVSGDLGPRVVSLLEWEGAAVSPLKPFSSSGCPGT